MRRKKMRRKCRKKKKEDFGRMAIINVEDESFTHVRHALPISFLNVSS